MCYVAVMMWQRAIPFFLLFELKLKQQSAVRLKTERHDIWWSRNFARRYKVSKLSRRALILAFSFSHFFLIGFRGAIPQDPNVQRQSVRIRGFAVSCKRKKKWKRVLVCLCVFSVHSFGNLIWGFVIRVLIKSSAFIYLIFSLKIK